MPKAKIAKNKNLRKQNCRKTNLPKKKLPKGKMAENFSPWQNSLNFEKLGAFSVL